MASSPSAASSALKKSWDFYVNLSRKAVAKAAPIAKTSVAMIGEQLKHSKEGKKLTRLLREPRTTKKPKRLSKGHQKKISKSQYEQSLKNYYQLVPSIFPTRAAAKRGLDKHLKRDKILVEDKDQPSSSN